MLWNRCLRSAAPRLDTPLREATLIARRLGCLGASPTAAVVAASATSPLMSALNRVSGYPRKGAPSISYSCQETNAKSHTDGTKDVTSTVSWWTLQNHQRQLFAQSHTPSEGPLVALTMSSVNSVHVEGVVTSVQCGYVASHAAGPSDTALPGRRTVCVTTPLNGAYPTVLLLLSVEDTATPSLASTASSFGCPLAVRCRLSPEVVEARWLVQQRHVKRPSCATGAVVTEDVASESSSNNGDKDGEDAAAVSVAAKQDKGKLTDAKLRCVKAWAAASLLHRRVIVSGQLRIEELYDGDLEKVVPVPVIEIPQDNLMGGLTPIDNV